MDILMVENPQKQIVWLAVDQVSVLKNFSLYFLLLS